MELKTLEIKTYRGLRQYRDITLSKTDIGKLFLVDQITLGRFDLPLPNIN